MTTNSLPLLDSLFVLAWKYEDESPIVLIPPIDSYGDQLKQGATVLFFTREDAEIARVDQQDKYGEDEQIACVLTIQEAANAGLFGDAPASTLTSDINLLSSTESGREALTLQLSLLIHVDAMPVPEREAVLRCLQESIANRTGA